MTFDLFLYVRLFRIQSNASEIPEQSKVMSAAGYNTYTKCSYSKEKDFGDGSLLSQYLSFVHGLLAFLSLRKNLEEMFPRYNMHSDYAHALMFYLSWSLPCLRNKLSLIHGYTV